MANFYEESTSSRMGVDKILNVKGNKECVDCGVENPSWASINLGILMCLDCSGVHRSLGTHISQVRSLDLDVQCWQGELLDFMCSVGNAAFNAVWEHAAPKGVMRPRCSPHNDVIRKYFITRKYQNKYFMASPTISAGVRIVKTQLVNKLGGKDKSMFHKWQPRALTLDSNSRLFYTKSESHITSALGIIDLKAPEQAAPYLELGSKKASKGFTFSVPTCAGSEHGGRTFLFSCEREEDCIEWVEAIATAIPHLSPLACWEEGAACPLEAESVALVELYCADSLDAIVKQGDLSLRFNGEWHDRHCTLTEDALFISDTLPGSAPAHMTAIPIKVLYLDRNVPRSEGDPAACFSLWHPLSHSTLAAQNDTEKAEWVDAIDAAVKRAKSEP